MLAYVILLSHVKWVGSEDVMAADEDDEHDAIWRALGSRWRRRMLDLLQRHPRTTNEVWAAFAADGLSRFAVMQHLRVLERAGLVVRRRSGRVTYNLLNPTPLKRIYRGWIRRYLGLRPASAVEMRARSSADKRQSSAPAFSRA
jgi:DNA-binding transcriptional ArsR family regulator